MSAGRLDRRGRHLVIATVVTLATGALVVSSAATRDGRDPEAAASSNDPGVAHVHGLGVNPADGALYAATHTGLFRIPDEGRATRIADRYQDTMGFTVVGPDRFLGSGHPDSNDRALRSPGRPPLLGLIESTDAGRSWKPLSLLGEADFHALAAIHDRVYGFEATGSRFMVSSDTRTWDTRSSIAIVGFAVDPLDPDHVVAATGRSLVASTDGGRSWESRAGPPLRVVSWDERTGLWGADSAGRVHRAAEDGAWNNVGVLAGHPQALLVRQGFLYAAAGDEAGRTSIYQSSNGRDWSLRYRDRER